MRNHHRTTSLRSPLSFLSLLLLLSFQIICHLTPTIGVSASSITTAKASTPLRSLMVLSAMFQFFHQFSQDSVVVEAATATVTSDAAATSTTATAADECAAPTTAQHVDVVEGVSLPLSKVLPDDGKPLYRNGHGIRSIPFFGMNIKVYVAHLYSRQPITTEAQALAMIRNNNNSTSSTPSVHKSHNHHHHNPLHFDFTFLRHVGKSRVVSAWTQQLEHSVTHTYHGYEDDRDTFIKLFSTQAIQHHGTQTVQLVGDETRIIDQGQHKGTIHGHEFQRAFLSMWFGDKAVAQDLKENLLQGHAVVAAAATTCQNGSKAPMTKTRSMEDEDDAMWEPLEPLAA